jgi:hypothetical protein
VKSRSACKWCKLVALSDRIGAVARTDLLGLATKHEPTGYWDIIKRDNPYKRARRHTYYI